METKKVISKSSGAILYSLGVAATLAKYGLTAAGSVLNGFENLSKDFLPISEATFGKKLMNLAEKTCGSAGSFLRKKGKDFWSR